MRRMVLLATALLLAGCGGDPAPPGVATAASGGARPGGTASTPSGAVAAYLEAQRKYVQCMRAEGIDLPDPDAKGRIDYSKVNADGALKKNPKFLAASEKCKDHVIEVPAELEDKIVMTPEQIARAREYAKCVRAHGDPDFPDPLPDGSWPRETGPGRDATEQETAAAALASETCAPVLEGKPPATPDPKRSGQG